MTELVLPLTIDEALVLLSECDGATVLAGGTSIMALKNSGLLDVPRLVALQRIHGMEGISTRGGDLVVGALTRLEDLVHSPLIRQAHPHVARAAGYVGNIRVRSQATLGGTIAHADPRQDLPPALMISAASAVLRSPSNQRVVSISEMYLGLMETVLEPDEVITEVLFPAPRSQARSDYVRFTPGSLSDFPTVSAAASARVRGGELLELAIALGSVGSTPIVIPTDSLVGSTPDARLIGMAIESVRDSISPVSDGLGSAEYKTYMAGILVGRLLCDILGLPLTTTTERLV